jgi:hypothetical protein
VWCLCRSISWWDACGEESIETHKIPRFPKLLKKV